MRDGSWFEWAIGDLLRSARGCDLCRPGAQINVRSCYNAGATGNIGGYQECVYTCKSDGSGYDQVCHNSSFNGEGHPLIEWAYCDYSAGSGCAADGDGTLNGRWTEITEQCSPSGNANPQIDRGACGGPCRQCPAGAGCEATTCPVPKLAPSGSCSWMASWDGHGLASVSNPVPQVQRSPFPRGMVGVPNQLVDV